MKSRNAYREGSWFAVTLRDEEGGYALGRIGRVSPGGGIALGYFFGPRQTTPPELGEVAALRSTDAIAVWIFGTLNLDKGKWPIMGSTLPWRREEWKIPDFIRREPISERIWRVVYDEDDPNCVVDELRMLTDDPTLDRDALSGAGAVEIMLTKLIRGEPLALPR